jgi:polyisoprenoid-binding protein YceI
MGTVHRIDMSDGTGGCTRLVSAVLALMTVASVSALSQQIDLKLDPAKTSVKFSLDAALHTVHGTFQAKPGALQFDPASGQISGAILVDAKSGVTGNGMRDRKMHKDVLESERYPEISFLPDRIDGAVPRPGKSSVNVHGVFRIHGVEREITVPAQVEMAADLWSAVVHFTIPYAKWGMKNPSTLFLRVNDAVEIELAASGTLTDHAATARDAAQ